MGLTISGSVSQNGAVSASTLCIFTEGISPPTSPAVRLPQLEFLSGFGPKGKTAVGNRMSTSLKLLL